MPDDTLWPGPLVSSGSGSAGSDGGSEVEVGLPNLAGLMPPGLPDPESDPSAAAEDDPLDPDDPPVDSPAVADGTPQERSAYESPLTRQYMAFKLITPPGATAQDVEQLRQRLAASLAAAFNQPPFPAAADGHSDGTTAENGSSGTHSGSHSGSNPSGADPAAQAAAKPGPATAANPAANVVINHIVTVPGCILLVFSAASLGHFDQPQHELQQAIGKHVMDGGPSGWRLEGLHLQEHMPAAGPPQAPSLPTVGGISIDPMVATWLHQDPEPQLTTSSSSSTGNSGRMSGNRSPAAAAPSSSADADCPHDISCELSLSKAELQLLQRQGCAGVRLVVTPSGTNTVLHDQSWSLLSLMPQPETEAAAASGTVQLPMLVSLAALLRSAAVQHRAPSSSAAAAAGAGEQQWVQQHALSAVVLTSQQPSEHGSSSSIISAGGDAAVTALEGLALVAGGTAAISATTVAAAAAAAAAALTAAALLDDGWPAPHPGADESVQAAAAPAASGASIGRYHDPNSLILARLPLLLLPAAAQQELQRMLDSAGTPHSPPCQKLMPVMLDLGDVMLAGSRARTASEQQLYVPTVAALSQYFQGNQMTACQGLLQQQQQQILPSAPIEVAVTVRLRDLDGDLVEPAATAAAAPSTN